MPIYDYHCDHCGHAFSAVQRFADDAIAACTSCGKPPRRLLSNPALVFKGSGWYKIDSRGPDKREKRDKGDTGTDKGADKATAGGDTGKPGSTDAPAAPDKTEKTEKTEKTGKTEGATGNAAPAKKPEKAAPASS